MIAFEDFDTVQVEHVGGGALASGKPVVAKTIAENILPDRESADGECLVAAAAIVGTLTRLRFLTASDSWIIF